MVIVLSHLGLTGDKALANTVSGIDIIVGGHSHNRMTKPERVGDTLIVQAGAHGSDLGRLTVIVDGGRMKAHEESPALDHNQFPPDDEMTNLVRTVSSAYAAELDEVIGSAESSLVRAQTLAGQEAERRDQESPIDSLFADIVRSESKADIGFLPGVGYGVAIPLGPVTAAQLRQLVPHDGKVVTMTLTGAQVRGILEQAVNNVHTEDVREKVGGMIQVSGLYFAYDSRKQRGDRISAVTVGDAELQNEREYRVATNSMLAGGGHNQQTFLGGNDKQELGSQYEVIRAWFKRRSPVRPPGGAASQERNDDDQTWSFRHEIRSYDASSNSVLQRTLRR